ncbi:hypothetical protein [Halobacillus sp. Marseille-P3879]|uniref:hypothetical protein n=1 Tax=Halobacillus sp. Marseille-P3879 TaxID=2045014 RepID=UPI001359E969|nr:hypothetical protein [Halobacillus sp. Marseille-P3879]
MDQDKPNIVLIMADQMASDVIGAIGHAAVQTPNIDRMVNDDCNSPICVPVPGFVC